MDKLTKKQWIIILVVIGLLVVGYVVNNNRTSTVINPVGSVPDSFIDSQIAQYNIMKNQNAMPDQCVMAKTIAQLYLQQQDEAKYAEWSSIGQTCEDTYMASMGVSQ